jgi:hypothetical protein
MSVVATAVTKRALSVVGRTEAAGTRARLFGGVGVAALLGKRLPQACRRVPGDLDLAAPKGDRKVLSHVLVNAGFEADHEFNTLYGHERLIFVSPEGLKVDVVIDVLRMCHVIDLQEGFGAPPPSLPAWLLLISKLQVFEQTEKDRSDAAALLAGCTVEELRPDLIARRCRDDWGLWRSLTRSLASVTAAPPELTVWERLRMDENADQLREALEHEPKSMRWKMRAAVGDRVRWYELPEEP